MESSKTTENFHWCWLHDFHRLHPQRLIESDTCLIIIIIIIIIINEYDLGAVKSQELLEHLTRLT